MSDKIKKQVILNLPYVILGLIATNLGEAWRLAEGADISEKLLALFGILPAAFQNPLPSFHSLDFLIGLACGAAFGLLYICGGRTRRNTAIMSSMDRRDGEQRQISLLLWHRSLRIISSSRKRSG